METTEFCSQVAASYHDLSLEEGWAPLAPHLDAWARNGTSQEIGVQLFETFYHAAAAPHDRALLWMLLLERVGEGDEAICHVLEVFQGCKKAVSATHVEASSEEIAEGRRAWHTVCQQEKWI